MGFSVRAVFVFLPILIGLAPGPVAAQNIALQIQHCNDYTAETQARIEACTDVIDSGRVPDSAPFIYLRAQLHGDQGNREATIDDLNLWLQSVPQESGNYYFAGASFAALGEFALAMDYYAEAIRLDPDNAAAYNNKAWLQSTGPDDDLRDGAQAVLDATRAVELEDSPIYRDTLAAAYAEAGNFERAVEEQERAVEEFEEGGDEANAADAQTRLELYRQNLPYRE